MISAAVPIDVLSAADIQLTGRTETAQIIQAVAPSFNFPRTSIGDGTDHIRPATLRGLAPDQTLVLVNGKRRHTSALVNVNGFVGRGSQAVDLNAIPASMIDHIEILRDGAAAQYGSDAIAGVLNIVLKTTAPGTFMGEVGENVTTYNRDATSQTAFPAQMAERSVHDGHVATSALNYGWTVGQNGFLQLSGEIRDRQGTNRTLARHAPAVFRRRSAQRARAADQSLAGRFVQSRQAAVLQRRHDASATGSRSYAFGGLGNRRGASAGFWRRANDDRTRARALPRRISSVHQVQDQRRVDLRRAERRRKRMEVGSRHRLRTQFLRVHDRQHGERVARTDVEDVVRRRPARVPSIDDDARSLPRSLEPLVLADSLALGGEFRRDLYEITAGEPDSYRNGGVKVLDASGNPTTRLAAVGSQVFPGFQPTDAGSHSRTNGAAYIDLESDLTEQLLARRRRTVRALQRLWLDVDRQSLGAIRACAHGSLSAARSAPGSARRRSARSSSRRRRRTSSPASRSTFAPSRSPRPRRKLLGASDLEPERSANYSAGVALEPFGSLALTVDFYRITIKNRIVLSDNFTGTTIQTAVRVDRVDGGAAAASSRTRSTRARMASTSSRTTDTASRIARCSKLTCGYNHNTVKVTHVDSTPANLKAFQENLFGRVERTRIEKGNPRDNLFVSVNYSIGGLGLRRECSGTARCRWPAQRATNATGTLDQTYGAKTITDLNASYTLRRYTLTVGADNVFDVYPDRNLNPGDPATGNGGISNFGIFPYAGISPFGFNGRFVYTKLSLGLR